MQQYFIPQSSVEIQQEFKKSIFITELSCTGNRTSVSDFISEIKYKHPNARHYCWACICGAPDEPHCLGFSDDGEPNGTAGKPMLAHLVGSGLGQITAVVTRYSGGIKLGTGGLVKAYGGGVAEAIKQLVTQSYIPLTNLKFYYDYPQQLQVELAIQQFDGKILHSHYLEKVTLELELALSDKANFIVMLKNVSKNQVQFIK